MIDKDEALKLALEALEKNDHRFELDRYENGGPTRSAGKAAITAIREALALSKSSTKCEETSHAQPEQEPVALTDLLREARDNCKASIAEEGISAARKEYRIDLEARLTATLNASQPASKPLNMTEIVRLTYDIDEDKPATMAELFRFARAIEAAYGIKE